MFLITSAAYINPGMASEFGKLPPCMLPVQNRRLYEHQIALVPEGEEVILSLPQGYSLSAFDEKSLSKLLEYEPPLQVYIFPNVLSTTGS